MRVVAESSVVTFADKVLPWLSLDPLRHNTAAQQIADRATGVQPVEQQSLWLGVWSGDAVVGVAARTRPGYLFLSPPVDPVEHPAFVAAVADWCGGHEPRLPGIGGALPAVELFADRWSLRTGAGVTRVVASRLFQLDAVTHPRGVSGALRAGGPGDRELLRRWVTAFYAEAVRYEDPPDAAPTVDRKIASGDAWLWCDRDAEPVSMLLTNTAVGKAVRISCVYTPPESRARGYASGCVAAVSQQLLDDGATVCVLYTDLANPTSNKIYQDIGYRAVQDTAQYDFTY